MSRHLLLCDSEISSSSASPISLCFAMSVLYFRKYSKSVLDHVECQDCSSYHVALNILKTSTSSLNDLLQIQLEMFFLLNYNIMYVCILS